MPEPGHRLRRPVRDHNGGRRLRVALYSHDAQGLGHLRRNLAIAGALAESHLRPDLLLLTGTVDVGAFRRPAGCDVVSLPALAKRADGSYAARHLGASLAELTRMRSSLLFAALAGFAPDVLLVDRHPRGAFGELEAGLDLLRARGGTRVVLGLRDVLDDPGRAREEWRVTGALDALDQWYDEVWVYGDPRVTDPVAQLDLPARLGGRVRHTGYLGRGAPQPADGSTGEPVLLGLVGGGSDGARLAAAFAAASLPEGRPGVLVLGPHMPARDRAHVHAIGAGRPRLEVLDSCSPIEPLLDRAAAVVAMGGYNTVCEVLGRRRPLLVVPRVRPRTEQLVRAERLAALDLLDVLHPDRLHPAALTRWLAAAVGRSGPPAAARVDLDGLSRMPHLVGTLAGAAPAPAAPPRSDRSTPGGAPHPGVDPQPSPDQLAFREPADVAV